MGVTDQVVFTDESWGAWEPLIEAVRPHGEEPGPWEHAPENLTRRPHVDEGSTPRAEKNGRPELSTDHASAARAAMAGLPEMLRQAEACGATTLPRHLGQALTEAEGLLWRTGPFP